MQLVAAQDCISLPRGKPLHWLKVCYIPWDKRFSQPYTFAARTVVHLPRWRSYCCRTTNCKSILQGYLGFWNNPYPSLKAPPSKGVLGTDPKPHIVLWMCTQVIGYHPTSSTTTGLRGYKHQPTRYRTRHLSSSGTTLTWTDSRHRSCLHHGYYLVQSHFVSPTTIPTLPVGHGVCPGNCNGQCHPTCKGRQPHRFSALGAIVRRRRRFLSPRIFWVMRYPARREYRCSYQHLTDILVYLVEDVPSPVSYSTGWSVYPVILVGETKPHNSGATKRQSHSATVGRKGRR